MNPKDMRTLLNELFLKLGLLDEIQSDCCNLTLSQCHTLLSVGRKGNLSVNDLAEEMNLNKSTASRHISQLSDKSLVTRIESTDDRRYLELQLTTEGHRQFQLIEKTMDKLYADVFNKIPNIKQPQVIDSLQTILEAINDCC